jgi:hypothetical protein
VRQEADEFPIVTFIQWFVAVAEFVLNQHPLIAPERFKERATTGMIARPRRCEQL